MKVRTNLLYDPTVVFRLQKFQQLLGTQWFHLTRVFLVDTFLELPWNMNTFDKFDSFNFTEQFAS